MYHQEKCRSRACALSSQETLLKCNSAETYSFFSKVRRCLLSSFESSRSKQSRGNFGVAFNCGAESVPRTMAPPEESILELARLARGFARASSRNNWSGAPSSSFRPKSNEVGLSRTKPEWTAISDAQAKLAAL